MAVNIGAQVPLSPAVYACLSWPPMPFPLLASWRPPRPCLPGAVLLGLGEALDRGSFSSPLLFSSIYSAVFICLLAQVAVLSPRGNHSLWPCRGPGT